MRYVIRTSGFMDYVILAHNGTHAGMPLPLQRVALLRRRVQANCPAASYWLRRDGSVEISPSCKDAGAQPVMHIALLSNCVAFLTDTSGWTSQRNDREALLPQTNRATRNVSRNLVQQIKLTELEHYGRRMCKRMCVEPRRVDRRKCGQQARPSMSFVCNTIDLPWRNFLSPEFGLQSYGGNT